MHDTRYFAVLSVSLLACADDPERFDGTFRGVDPSPSASLTPPGFVPPAVPQVDPVHGAPPTGGYFGAARLEPATGTYFGVSLDPVVDSPAEFNERLGHGAADFVVFVDFPMDEAAATILDGSLTRAAAQGALAVVTFEPQIPLADITSEMAEEHAATLAAYNDTYEIGILVRFAHEMNGTWYAWGQQPAEYVRAFRLLAHAVHRQALRTAMVWAPNYGGGYPFAGGEFLAGPDHSDFDVLDTNGDGALTSADEPYLPYYPGDDAVDWVALSLYHWGHDYPFGENEIPEPNKFVDKISGDYDGLAGDQTQVPDFYDTFTEQRGKPLAIVETGALYALDQGGADELDLKSAWWRQVFGADVAERFPRLRLINWFELVKLSPETDGGAVDWTVTVDETIRDAFLADLPVERLNFAPIPVYEP